jgi:cytochrome c oxidase subunit II
MRRGSIVQLVLIGAVVGAGATLLALLVPWLPPAASEESDRIDFVFWFTTAICIGIFALVAAVILYSVVRFRARPDDDSDGPPVHGHTGLAIVSGVVLTQNDHLPKDRLVVDVTAQQFVWSFKYPAYKDLTTGTLRLPLGKTVQLRISAVDVIHSFWVPQFRQKQDALPGQVNNLKITPKELGEFPVICTELCGLGHAAMRTSAVVMEPEAFQAWIRKEQKAIAGGGAGGGKAVFANNGCGSCHVFMAAGSMGKVGPDLDKLPEHARRAGKPLEEFVRESIVDPNAYIEPGFNPNLMPANYATLPKQQLDALVKFLTSGKGSK